MSQKSLEESQKSIEESPIKECLETAKASTDDLLFKHYQSLTPESITEDVTLMKEANIKELYTLIASDCLHYVSLIENYKEENLQSICQLLVRRIDGHLLIKFRFRADDPWTDVGFTDESNTIEETLVEMKRTIELQLRASFSQNQKCLQKKFEDQSQEIPYKVSITDVETDFPTITDQQRESAGYKSIPPQLRGLEKNLRTPLAKTFEVTRQENPQGEGRFPDLTDNSENLNKFNTHEPLGVGRTGVTQNYFSSSPHMDRAKHDLEGPCQLQLLQHKILLQECRDLRSSLQEMTPKNWVYLHHYLVERLAKYDPSIIAGVILELI